MPCGKGTAVWRSAAFHSVALTPRGVTGTCGAPRRGDTGLNLSAWIRTHVSGRRRNMTCRKTLLPCRWSCEDADGPGDNRHRTRTYCLLPCALQILPEIVSKVSAVGQQRENAGLCRCKANEMNRVNTARHGTTVSEPPTTTTTKKPQTSGQHHFAVRLANQKIPVDDSARR